MSIGSLLWIHGKRKFLLISFAVQDLMVTDLSSGVREERSLVCHFLTIMVNERNSL